MPHGRRVERQLRPQAGRPRRPQQRLPARAARGRPDRPSCTCQDPPAAKIPDRAARRRLDLIYDRRSPTTAAVPPAPQLFEVFADVKSASGQGGRSAWPVEEQLKHHIIDGERDGLPRSLDDGDDALQARSDIINDILLDGMKIVGELFGSGQMQLPFVLQSAEIMKTAVSHLEPLHGEGRGPQQGHDRAGDREGRRPRHRQEPGRHHPDQQRLHGRSTSASSSRSTTSCDACKEHEADAIGMSGLLVKSTRDQQENLEELNAQGLTDPRAARRRGADAQVRRGGPPRRLQGPPLLRAATPSRACARWTT